MRPRTVLAALIALAAGALVLVRRQRRKRAVAVPAPPAPAALPPAPCFLSIPWELAAAPDVEGTELTIRLSRSGHMTLDRVDVRETPTQVYVTVIVAWSPPAGGWFADEIEETAAVVLREPLGERELVHAAIDADATPAAGPLYP